jgi:hypothetical protein
MCLNHFSCEDLVCEPDEVGVIRNFEIALSGVSLVTLSNLVVLLL